MAGVGWAAYLQKLPSSLCSAHAQNWVHDGGSESMAVRRLYYLSPLEDFGTEVVPLPEGFSHSPMEKQWEGWPLKALGPRHDEDLREPLVRRQGSQVSMRVARGSASWLSSHGRVLSPLESRRGSGGAPRDSAGSGATEEGLTSRGGRNLRLPLRFVLRPQGPRTGKSCPARPPQLTCSE